MHRLFVFLCCIIILMNISLSVSFSDGTTSSTQVDGEWEYYILKNDTVYIVRYNGQDEHVVIPQTVGSKTVFPIGRNAFYSCKSLGSVDIPDCAIKTGVNALCLCSSLSSITIPDSVQSIYNQAFICCSSLTVVSLPISVSTMGRNPFELQLS